MSEQKYEVGGQIQDAKGAWHEVISVGSEMPFINNGDHSLVGMPPNFIRDYRPPSRTVRQWIETLPAGIRERALRCMEKCSWCNGGVSANKLHLAIVDAFPWASTPEGNGFWESCFQAARDSTPFPEPPDLGYGTDRLTGEVIEAPEGIEIVPEGERVEPGAVFFNQGSRSFVPVIFSGNADFDDNVRAFARPIRRHRKADVGELWKLGSGLFCEVLGFSGNVTVVRFTHKKGIADLYRTIDTARGDTFIAPSLEAYYRDGYVKIEDVRRELSAGERITVNIGGESEMEVVRRERIDDILDKLGIKEGKQ